MVDEIQKRQQIVSLMSAWLSGIERKYEAKPDPVLWAEGPPRSYFVVDGFLPNYYNQLYKVLFVGRETRGVTSGGDNYVNGDLIGSFLGGFKAGITNNNFWRHLMIMVQLFKHDGKIEFEQLKKVKASDYAKKMVETGDYGFAFMNISKYSNDKDDGGKADYDFINQFLEDSQLEKHNYFQDELKILDPEYIITGNLWDGNIDKKYLELCFGKLTQLSAYPPEAPEAKLFEMDLDGKKIKLVDVYHFSSIKPDKESFFIPIKELLFSDRGRKQ
jgi:hypothetical protein